MIVDKPNTLYGRQHTKLNIGGSHICSRGHIITKPVRDQSAKMTLVTKIIKLKNDQCLNDLFIHIVQDTKTIKATNSPKYCKDLEFELFIYNWTCC